MIEEFDSRPSTARPVHDILDIPLANDALEEGKSTPKIWFGQREGFPVIRYSAYSTTAIAPLLQILRSFRRDGRPTGS